MNTSEKTVKLFPNSSPFPISVDRLTKLYEDIRTNSYLQLDCLSLETAKDNTIDTLPPSSTSSQQTQTPDLNSKKQPIKAIEDPASSKFMNIAKRLLPDNNLKRSRDTFDFQDTDLNDQKHKKIMRTSTEATGEFEKVIASLASDYKPEREPQSPPINSTPPARPDRTASNVQMDFEYEATSPTGITFNIQDTVNHIKDTI